MSELLESKLRQLENIKNALKDLTTALNSEEYNNDYVFKAPPNAANELRQPFLKALAQKLNDKGIGFDPALIVQHIEKEILRQFNEEIELSIKGIHSSKLLSLKHELEKFDLKDRVEHFTGKLTELEKEVLSLQTGVNIIGAEDEESSKKADNKKANKKR